MTEQPHAYDGHGSVPSLRHNSLDTGGTGAQLTEETPDASEGVRVRDDGPHAKHHPCSPRSQSSLQP
jgi:hypothetical protein